MHLLERMQEVRVLRLLLLCRPACPRRRASLPLYYLARCTSASPCCCFPLSFHHPTPIQPRTALDVAAEIHAPILALYGGADTGIPVASVEAARDKAQAAGKSVELVVYPDAPHGFHADYRPSYRPTEAKDGWTRALSFLKMHGVG